MRASQWTVFFLLAPLTLATAEAQTTILERDRSDRQAPVKLPADKSKPEQPATQTNVAPFEPFVLRHVNVEGSSLSDRALENATSRFIGATMDRPAIDALTKEMSDAYGKSDVALYSIFVPNQTGENGALRIVVVEGRVDEVLVSGDAPTRNLEYAQRILAPVINEKPLRRSTMERALALLSGVPGMKAESRLLKTDQRGVVKLAVALKLQEFEAGIGIGTRGSTELGRTQMQADVSANSLLRAGDRTTLSYATPVDLKHFRYYSLSHSTPLTASGLTLSGAVGHLITEPRGIAVRGKATTAAFQLSYPLLLSFKEALSLSLGVDGLNSDNAFLGESVSSDWTRAVRLSASYIRQIDNTRLIAALSVSHGLDAFGARTSTPLYSDLSFLKVNGTLGYELMMFDTIVLRMNATGQYTNDKLPSAEQSSLGGELYGRAFDAAVATGDKSIAGSAELAYPLKELPRPFSNTELYAFVDGGALWREARAGFDGSTTGLSSAGIGTRFTVFSNVSFGVELARELDTPDTDPEDEGWRAIFSFSTRTGL